MGFLDSISAVVSPLSSLGGLVSGLFGESSAQKEQQQAIQSLQASNALQDQQLQESNQRTLFGATGEGGDAIRALGSSLGSGFANAGLYNSSAVAGGLLRAQQNTNTSLADLAAHQQSQEQQLAAQQRNQVAQMQYNLGGQNLGYARTDTATAAGGLQHYLQSMTQHALAASGNTMTPGGGNGSAGPWGSLPSYQNAQPGYDGMPGQIGPYTAPGAGSMVPLSGRGLPPKPAGFGF